MSHATRLMLFAIIVLAGCRKVTTTTSPFQPPLCTAKTCVSEGLSCGFIDDGCGAMRLCGECQAPAFCLGGRCVMLDAGQVDAGCTPMTCPASLAEECATLDDGCGHALLCGCGASEACVNGLCGCVDDGGCGAPSLLVRGVPGGTVELQLSGPFGGWKVARSHGSGPAEVFDLPDAATYTDPAPPTYEWLSYRLQASDGGARSNAVLVHRTNTWPTPGGDNQHSGANPLETGHPPLTQLWSFAFNYGGVGQVVASDGIVFVKGENETYDGTRLVALDAQSGALLYELELTPGDGNQPSIYDGTLYFAQCETMSLLLSLEPADGGQHWAVPGGCVGGAMMLQDGTLYFHDGNLGALDPSDGGLLVHGSANLQGPATLSAYGGRIYAYSSGVLEEFDERSSNQLRRFATFFQNGTPDTSPVFADGRVFLVFPPALVSLSLSTFQQEWATSGPVVYRASAGYYRGTLYALAMPGTLVALDPATGTVLWSFDGDGQLRYPPVFAGDYLYVASDRQIFAVNLATHLSAWSSDTNGTLGGPLAIEGGRLYATGLGLVEAFSLTP